MTMCLQVTGKSKNGIFSNPACATFTLHFESNSLHTVLMVRDVIASMTQGLLPTQIIPH